MSSKHFRRFLIEQEVREQEEEEEVSDEEPQSSKNKVNKFTFLYEDNKSEESVHADSSAEEMIKKNTFDRGLKSTDKKKKQKKNKAGQKQVAELDDVFSLNTTDLGAPSNMQTNNSLLMKIDPRSLNPDDELRKLLGKAFAGSAAADNINPRQVQSGRVTHRVFAGRMVKAKPEWPPIRHLGIFMSVEKEENGIKWYRFQHNEQYQLVQQHFWLYQRHMDHESILNSVLVKNPYHLDSLLLLAEIMRIQEDIQNSRDTIAMGLYACENVFHSGFQLFSMDHRLSFAWRENRSFFLLLHWHMFNLAQRRCFSTALQFAKIIFMKDPVDDPLAILMLIDSLALKAKDYQFLIAFYTEFKEQKNLCMLPNFLYSMALAHYFLSCGLSEEKQKHTETAEQYLELALCRFPFLLVQILDALNIQPDSQLCSSYYLNSLAFSRESDGIKLISKIYLHHSLELWKLPNVLSWLETTTHVILPRLSQALKPQLEEWTKRRKRCFVGMPQNLERHAVLHNIQHETSATNSIADPCPPTDTSHADYEPIDMSDIAGSSHNVSSGVVTGFVRSLLQYEYQAQLDTFGGTLREYAGNFLGDFQRFLDRLHLGGESEGGVQAQTLPLGVTREENANSFSSEPTAVEASPNTSSNIIAAKIEQNEEDELEDKEQDYEQKNNAQKKTE